MTGAPASPSGHLDYYLDRGISPVRYDRNELDVHLRIRDSLYRTLGLPVVAFKGSRVLEVAPGSGRNGLYIATCLPVAYDLVEPNPVGVADIRAHFGALELSHTVPTLHEIRFEGFAATHNYDIVICENWLGGLPHERALLRKLAGLVAPGGVLVFTMVQPVALAPNILRKLLSLRILDPGADFEQQTNELIDVFGPQLATIAGMNRSYRDWVQDNMLSPHFLNITMTPESIVEDLGETMEFMASSPAFRTDWRWFKQLTGRDRGFNRTFVEMFDANLHNFIDHRRRFPPRASTENRPLKALGDALLASAQTFERAWHEGCEVEPGVHAEIGRIAIGFGEAFAALDPEIEAAFREVGDLWARPAIDAASVGALSRFGRLFARETVYMSFTRARD